MNTTKAKTTVELTREAYASFIFAALSRDNWAQVITEGLGHFIFFPAFAGIALVKLGFHAYDLIMAPNKNIGKVARFLKELVSGSIILTAVIGGLFVGTALAALAPVLFVVAMGFNTLYNFFAAMQNAYHLLTTSDPVARQQYKALLIKHAIGTFIGAVTTLAVGLMMIAKVGVVAMAIGSAVANGLGVVFAFKAMLAQRQGKSTTKTAEKTPENTHYLSEKNRAAIVLHHTNAQTYLLSEITEKVATLETEIDNGKHDLYSQTEKRTAKITELNNLKSQIENPNSDATSYEGLISNSLFKKNVNKGLFQSFFRKKSDTQDIFDAAEVYFTNQPLNR